MIIKKKELESTTCHISSEMILMALLKSIMLFSTFIVLRLEHRKMAAR